jgi:hypothetical protein
LDTTVDNLVIRFIKDQEQILLHGQPRQAPDFIFALDPAGRVAGAGDKNDLGLLGDAFLDGFEIDMKVLFEGRAGVPPKRETESA